MTISEYKAKVIELFRSGQATDKQYEEMASAILTGSENDYESVDAIDTTVLGPLQECEDCGALVRPGENECLGCS